MERKTADDLAASIADGRYNTQKYRLINCGLKKVFYLIEGKATKHSTFPQQTIESAILSTQIIHHFFIQHTENIQETIIWLTHMSLFIQKDYAKNIQMKLEEPLEFPSPLQDFLFKNTKTFDKTVGHTFGKMLRGLKGCGKEHTMNILNLYRTPLQFYSAINLRSIDEVVDFLSTSKSKKNKSKSSKEPFLHLPKNLANLIAILFTAQAYPMEKPPSTQPSNPMEAE